MAAVSNWNATAIWGKVLFPIYILLLRRLFHSFTHSTQLSPHIIQYIISYCIVSYHIINILQLFFPVSEIDSVDSPSVKLQSDQLRFCKSVQSSVSIRSIDIVDMPASHCFLFLLLVISKSNSVYSGLKMILLIFYFGCLVIMLLATSFCPLHPHVHIWSSPLSYCLPCLGHTTPIICHSHLFDWSSHWPLAPSWIFITALWWAC